MMVNQCLQSTSELQEETDSSKSQFLFKLALYSDWYSDMLYEQFFTISQLRH